MTPVDAYHAYRPRDTNNNYARSKAHSESTPLSTV